MKKICIAFGCGLGNQMFQYAFYVAMRKQYPHHTFLIDKKVMLPQQHNGYELDRVFGIELEECRLSDYIGYIRHIYMQSKMAMPLNLLFYVARSIWPNKNFYKQKDYSAYYPEVFSRFQDSNAFLKGIWANENYFEGNREELLKQFTFRQELDKKNRELLKQIDRTDSVSIHIRRGDYCKGNNHLLSGDYYKRATDLIRQKLDAPVWFVFSDDMEAAKELMADVAGGSVVFVGGNTGDNSWKDLYLMSRCKHHIIANSSFSFWGAWLNRSEDKIVISSATPMSDTMQPFTCKDWIQI